MRSLEERVSPGRATLVVIDVQNDFCHEAGAYARAGADVAGIQLAVARLEYLVEQARHVDVPVIFVRTEHGPFTDSEAWLHRRPQGEPSRNCLAGSWGAEFYRLRPQPGEVVITKHRYSAFVGTPLEQVLRSLRRDSLLFGGVATNVCVESSARDALMRDYHVTLVADCCAAKDAQRHQAAVRNIQENFGWVATSDQVVRAWQACPVRAVAPEGSL